MLYILEAAALELFPLLGHYLLCTIYVPHFC